MVAPWSWFYTLGMVTRKPETTSALNALEDLSIEAVEKRLAEIEGERASLSVLRRSLAARERAQRKTQSRWPAREGGHSDD